MGIYARLETCLKTGKYDEFIGLLNDNESIDIACGRGYEILLYAIRIRKIEYIRELLRHGEVVNTVLPIVAYSYFRGSVTDPECFNIIKLLIESGADCNYHWNSDGEDLLHFFCWFGNGPSVTEYLKEIVVLLLDRGANRDYVFAGRTTEKMLRDFHRDDLADFVRDYEVGPGTKGVHFDGRV